MFKFDKATAIGVVATLIGMAATVIGNVSQKQQMQKQVAEEVAKALKSK